MKRFGVVLAFLMLIVGTITSCAPGDGYPEDVYIRGNFYVWNPVTLAYDLVNGGLGGGIEADPIFTASPAFGITALNIADWSGHSALTTGIHGVGAGDVVGTTLIQELDSKTLDASVGKGTWTNSGVWKLPAMYFNGDITTDRWLSSEDNTILGVSAMGAGNLAHTGGAEGYHNTAIGHHSMSAITTGSFNTGLGAHSLIGITTGTGNTAIGALAGYSLQTGSYNVFLGAQAGGAELGSNKLYIDNTDTATPLIYGDFSTDTLVLYGSIGVGVAAPSAYLHLKAGTATASTAPLKFTSGVLLTTPESGAMEFDGTAFYYTDVNLVRKTFHRTDYAGAYLHENAVPYTIEEASTPHALHGWTSDGLSTNWAFYAGKSLAITAQADNGDGKTQITCNLHGLANNDIVTIANTTSYDGIYKIEQVAANTFVIQKAWVANEGAKVGHAAGYLTNASASSTGVYLACGMVSITPANPNDVFEFEFYLDTTEQTNTESQIKLGAVGDYSCATTQGIINYTAGQKLWAKVENISGAGDLTARDGTMVMTRIN